MIRPIGSIFEFQFVRDPMSPNPDTGSVFTYQVIAHDNGREVLYPMSVRYRRVVGLRPFIDAETGFFGGWFSIYHPDDLPARVDMDES